jgi:hypothetical protein
LANVALTDQLATQITTDTQNAIEQKIGERQRKAERLSKAGETLSKTKQALSTYTAVEGTKEMEVSLQRFGANELSLPSFFVSRDAKWRHMPYYALQRIFEFHGEWGLNRVSRRWYDCFMNYIFQFRVPTNKLVLTMSKCVQSITTGTPGWSEEHSSFWRKLTSCHIEAISVLTILPTLSVRDQQSRYRINARFRAWVSTELIRPCFAIRDKNLFEYLCRAFDDRSWILSTMNSEFAYLAQTFTRIRRFGLFLNEYGYLAEELKISPKMISEMAKLPGFEDIAEDEE